MQVERLTNEAEWEQFIGSVPGGTFYHTLKWKRILEEAFSAETEYLVIRDSSGNLAGVCPFVISRRMGMLKILDSLPHSDFGGPLVAEGQAEVVLKSLQDYLLRLGRERHLTYAKIRCHGANLADHLRVKGATVDTSSGTMNLDLDEKPPDAIWNEVFSQRGGQRTYIRRFEKDGFQNIEARDIDDLNTFYRLYYSNMSYIGAAPRSYAFFQRLWDQLYPDYFNILLTVGNGRCIGAEGFFVYDSRKTVYQTFIGLDRDVGTQYRTYYYLSWGLIKWCQQNDFKTLSFGSTPSDPDSTNYALKSKFGPSFSQDYLVSIPFDRKLFLVRGIALKLARSAQKRLPRSLQRKLRKAGSGL